MVKQKRFVFVNVELAVFVIYVEAEAVTRLAAVFPDEVVPRLFGQVVQ